LHIKSVKKNQRGISEAETITVWKNNISLNLI